MQTLVVVLQPGRTFLLPVIVLSSGVDDVTCHDFLPEGKAASNAYERLWSVSEGKGVEIGCYKNTPMHSISRRHDKPICRVLGRSSELPSLFAGR